MHPRHLYSLILFLFLGPLSINRLSAQDIKSLKRVFLDMVYVPQEDRFYATSSAYDNPTKSMLYRINPYSATIEDSTQVGYYIHKLAVTDDGRFLYIAERGSSVYRFDLATKKVVLTIKITNVRPQDSLSVSEIKAVPQTPNSVVAIVQGYTYSSSTTIFLLENANVAATSAFSFSQTTITFGKNPNIIYAYDAFSTGEALMILERQGATWRQIRYYQDFVGTFAGNIKVDDGFLYANGGPFRLKLIGDFPEKDGQWKPQLEPDAQTYNVRPLFQSDPLSNVVYALSSEYVSSTGYAYYLSAYSKTNYLLVKKMLLPKLVPFEYLRQLTQWGTGRLAGLDNKQIIFVRDCTPSVSTPPTIEQGLTANVCRDSSVILSASAGFSNYLWTTGDTGRTIKIRYPVDGSSISVAVSVATSAQACLSPYSATTVVEPQYQPSKPTITTNNVLTVCQGDSVLALASNQTTNNDFLWSNGAKGSVVFFKNSGTYTAKAISTEGCASPPSEPISVTIRPDLSPARPTVTVTGDTALCAGESVTLSTNAGFTAYEWANSAATTASITVNPSFKTSYGVRVTTAAGCKSNWSEFVSVNTYSTPTKPTITANLNCMATQIVAEKYQWFWNNTILQGATQQFNLAVQRGGYTVKAINGRCASPISDVVNY